MRMKCEPGESYVIVSQFLARRLTNLLHFASWDFSVSTNYNKVKDMDEAAAIEFISKELSVDVSEARRIYYDKFMEDPNLILDAAPPLQQIDIVCGYAPETNQVKCGQSMLFDLNSSRAVDNKAVEHPFLLNVPALNLSAKNTGVEGDTIFILYQERDRMKLAVAGRGFAESTFVRLYYLNGMGLEHFTMLGDYHEPYSKKPKLFRINW